MKVLVVNYICYSIKYYQNAPSSPKCIEINFTNLICLSNCKTNYLIHIKDQPVIT